MATSLCMTLFVPLQRRCAMRSIESKRYDRVSPRDAQIEHLWSMTIVGSYPRRVSRIEAAVAGACALAVGGTAVGTGLNADPRFGEVAAKQIAEETGRPFFS